MIMIITIVTHLAPGWLSSLPLTTRTRARAHQMLPLCNKWNIRMTEWHATCLVVAPRRCGHDASSRGEGGGDDAGDTDEAPGRLLIMIEMEEMCRTHQVSGRRRLQDGAAVKGQRERGGGRVHWVVHYYCLQQHSTSRLGPGLSPVAPRLNEHQGPSSSPSPPKSAPKSSYPSAGDLPTYVHTYYVCMYHPLPSSLFYAHTSPILSGASPRARVWVHMMKDLLCALIHTCTHLSSKRD